MRSAIPRFVSGHVGIGAAVAALVLSQPACRSDSDGAVSRSRDFSNRVDSLFAPYDTTDSPGGVVAVLFRGELVHLRGYGAANREFGIPWASDTRYRIASITKGFVGHAALLLEEQGLLSLEDTVQQYLPDFPSFRSPLRIRHLLTMTSGLWQDEILLALAGVTGRATLNDMYALSRRQDGLNFAPGTSYIYVDTGFRLMARIIEVVTGKSWPNAMADLIFEPLGMASTLAAPDIAQVFDGQGTTYVRGPDPAVPLRFEFPFDTSGDGSIITTLDDLILWLQHLKTGFEGGESLFDRLKEPATLAGMGEMSGYGLGIRGNHHRGLQTWGHGGATGTRWTFYPALDLLLVFFTNYLGEISTTELVRDISDAFLESDLNPDSSILSADNPEREKRFLEAATLPPEDAAILSDVFVESNIGYVLASEPGGGHSFNGAATFLEKIGECEYRSASFVHWVPIHVRAPDCDSRAEPNLLIDYGDWRRARRFVRASPRDVGTRRARDYVGHYYSSQLGAQWSIERNGSTLKLRIGAGVEEGQRFVLEGLAWDVFKAIRGPSLDYLAIPPMSLRFVRDRAGRVFRMQVSTARVHGLVFEKQ